MFIYYKNIHIGTGARFSVQAQSPYQHAKFETENIGPISGCLQGVSIYGVIMVDGTARGRRVHDYNIVPGISGLWLAWGDTRRVIDHFTYQDNFPTHAFISQS